MNVVSNMPRMAGFGAALGGGVVVCGGLETATMGVIVIVTE